jgi:hypothetical protein
MALDNAESVRQRLFLFSGGTGGFDSLLTGEATDGICNRLSDLNFRGLSCSNLNHLLARAHQPSVSQGFFRYYWLSAPAHIYDVSTVPGFDDTYTRVDLVLTLDQFSWGLSRIYTDSLLLFGSINNGFRALRLQSFTSLSDLFNGKRYDDDAMMRRGEFFPLERISQDERYLIAEQACKSFDPVDGDESANFLLTLKGAWQRHVLDGGGRVPFRQILSTFCAATMDKGKQEQFEFSAVELMELEISSEGELMLHYDAIAGTFASARQSALKNTQLYLSMANDLDVYVATSMRNRQQFRDMAKTCDQIFEHPAVRHLHLRYFEPTLSAAAGHEDKGLIECLMVKCSKTLIYMAGDKDSYGKDAEAAMALSLGRPVIFLCDELRRRQFFSDIHPLSRLIDFQSGVAVGAMATSSPDEAAQLLGRIFENKMQYNLEHPKPGYFRLKERRTGSVVRLQTNDRLLRETFWNCYHMPK